MKQLLFIFLLLPAIVFAQTKTDYEQAVVKFMEYYNNNQAERICQMFTPGTWAKHKCLWSDRNLSEMIEKYGKIVSLKYLGKDTEDPEGVIVFKVNFTKEKEAKALSLTLEKENRLGTFRFITSSPQIDAMLLRAR